MTKLINYYIQPTRIIWNHLLNKFLKSLKMINYFMEIYQLRILIMNHKCNSLSKMMKISCPLNIHQALCKLNQISVNILEIN